MINKHKKLAHFFVNSFSTFLMLFYSKLHTSISVDDRIRILVYHSINTVYKNSQLEEWTVEPKAFDEQMRYLKENKYNIMLVDELPRYINTSKPFPPKTVCITFDDGYYNNYLYAFPIMKQYNIQGTFFLATDYIGKNRPFSWIKNHATIKEGSEEDIIYRFPLSWSQVTEMESNGMKFGSHTSTHSDIASLQPDEVLKEIEDAKKILLEKTYSPSEIFCCPFGIEGNSKKLLCKYLKSNGYAGAFLGKLGATKADSDIYDIPRFSIYNDDSLQVFKTKINGAYDWTTKVAFVWRLYKKLLLGNK